MHKVLSRCVSVKQKHESSVECIAVGKFKMHCIEIRWIRQEDASASQDLPNTIRRLGEPYKYHVRQIVGRK